MKARVNGTAGFGAALLGLATLPVGGAAAWGWIKPAVMAALLRLAGTTP